MCKKCQREDSSHTADRDRKMFCTLRRRRRPASSFLVSRQLVFPGDLFEDKIDNVSEGRPYERAYEQKARVEKPVPGWQALTTYGISSHRIHRPNLMHLQLFRIISSESSSSSLYLQRLRWGFAGSAALTTSDAGHMMILGSLLNQLQKLEETCNRRVEKLSL